MLRKDVQSVNDNISHSDFFQNTHRTMTAISMSQENNVCNSHVLLNGPNDLVIAGISGRLSDVDSINDLAKNLFQGIDMATGNDRHSPEELIHFQDRNGKSKGIDRFDNTSFSVNSMPAHYMSSLLQLLFEVTYESICDAGVNPTKIKGTETGVFITTSGFDAPNIIASDSNRLEGPSFTGYRPSMFANRLSYAFDFRGRELFSMIKIRYGVPFLFPTNQGPSWTTDRRERSAKYHTHF